MSDALIVSGLSTGYGDRSIISDLSLPDVSPGEVMALIGPNGAGKSTLLRALAGLQPARGSIALAGRELHGLSLAERAKSITYMPQTLPQGVALTVLETLVSALRASPVAGMAPEDDAGHALTVLQRLGMGDLAMQRLDQLSGGQRQLASLAQAVVRGPRVLLLDEPTSALDLRHQLRVLKLVRELAAEQRMIVIMVLHDLQAAARASDRVVVLSQGLVAASGTPAEAITPQILAEVYQVRARVEHCARGTLQVLVDDIL